ncbi:MAG TPA: T9SS type A sorting domain-containing protein, partial [Rhodothermales bacterium]|nr:T9SS type A sorting domain-containing protein [Rhodothermales bacterium]
WAALINLRKRQPVFTDPATTVTLNTAGTVKRILLRGTGATGLDVVIVGNFGVTTQTATPAFTRTGAWYDFFGRREVNVTDVSGPLTLAPGEFHIYTSRFVDYPEANLVVGLQQVAGAAQATRLDAVWPNPAREGARVRYGLATGGAVRVEVFDVLGRRAAVLVDEEQAPGVYDVTLDTDRLAAGAYVVRFSTGSTVQTRPLVVVK